MKEKSKLQIFLAHASEDKNQIGDLYEKLQENGYRPWLDEKDLIPGQVWDDMISQAIQNSDLFIACLSEHSITKRGYVQKEFRMALEYCAEQPFGSLYLIPLKLDDCEIPNLRQSSYGISLRNYQWLNYYEPGGFEALIRAVEYKRAK